jgi:hypothetical protein
LLVGKVGGGKQKQKKKPATTRGNGDDAGKEGSKQKAAKNSKGVGKGKAGINPSANKQVGNKSKGTTATLKGKRAHPSKRGPVERRPPATRRSATKCADRAGDHHDTWVFARPLLFDPQECT